jgi:hypothetical protein
MNLLERQQFGPAEGAKRFAECMFLLNTMVVLGHVLERINTYVRVVHYYRHPEQFAASVFHPIPKALANLSPT